MADRKYIEALPDIPRRRFGRNEVLRYLQYNPDNGLLKWKVRVQSHGGGRQPGDIAGTDKDGYREVSLFGKRYRAHHLAWLIMTGEWPPRDVDIDHINRDRSDNRWANLRIATRGQNNMNASGNGRGKNPHRGVYASRNGQRWNVRITVDKKYIGLGTYDSIEEAVRVRKAAERKYFGAFA